MPAPSLKKLYLASSIEELQKKITLEQRLLKQPTAKLRNAADKLYQSAEKCNLDRDEEKAYVQYMKLVELCLFLYKERPEMKESQYNPKQLRSAANSALEKATDIKNSLLKRYEFQKEALQVQEKETESSLTLDSPEGNEENMKDDVNTENIVPEVSNSFSKSATSKGFLTCEDLYAVLRDLTSSVIIMDVRSEKDFERSHLKHSCCINIPKEILTKGITAFTLQKKLPETSLAKWLERSKADYIILVDDETVSTSIASDSPLYILRDAMCKWDPQHRLKAEPHILAGGYKEWMLKYPMFTTAVISFIEEDTPAVTIDFSGVVYPSLDDCEEPSKTIVNGVKEDSLDLSYPLDRLHPDRITNGWFKDISASRTETVSEQPSFNRKLKPQSNSLNKDMNSSAKQTETGPQNVAVTSESYKKSLKSVPVVNRFLKPKTEIEAVSSSQSIEKSSDTSETDFESVSAQEKAERDLQYAKFCLQKECEAEESRRLELQKREEFLIEEMRKLDLDKQEKEKQIIQITEDFKKMQMLMDKKGEDFEAKLREKERQLEIERLRQVRKNKEYESKTEASVRKNSITTLQPDIQRDAQQPGRNRSTEPGGSFSKDLRPQEKSLGKDHTAPLAKETTGRGLTRSHSFHNIVQTVAQEKGVPSKKTPVFDRSLKPVDSTTVVDDVSVARQRNLKPIYGCPGIPLTGLRNLGNTCFMSAAIQCLSNTKPLAEYFDKNLYRSHLNRENVRGGTKGEVAEEFAVVIKALWNGQYKSVSPTDFKSTVSKYLPVCVGNEQQDSHEFLVVLMDKLHGDLKQKCTPKPFPKLDSLPENEAREVFWNYHRSQNHSKIADLFEGLLKSTLTCLYCRKTSDSYEVFSCLSLPIPFSRCSVQDCLRSFMKPEKMCGEGAWDCPKCHQKRESQKQMSVSRLPDILIIQLKRFSYEGLWRSKLQTFVDFELKFEMSCVTNSGTKYKIYQLYGIVNHIGTLEGGHYTAYCKNYSNEKWYKYDDHEVTRISSSDIKTSDAYLLFYSSLETGCLK